jgi:hypothetical protein
MPTARAFAAVPPFPSDVPVYELPKLSLKKLLSNNEEESSALFQSFREHGFMLLDLQGCAEGEEVLEEAEKMFEVTEAVTLGLPIEEKLNYPIKPPKIFG